MLRYCNPNGTFNVAKIMTEAHAAARLSMELLRKAKGWEREWYAKDGDTYADALRENLRMVWKGARREQATVKAAGANAARVIELEAQRDHLDRQSLNVFTAPERTRLNSEIAALRAA